MRDRRRALIDAHVQLMPESMARAVRADLQANYWHPRFAGSTEEAIQTLEDAGVTAFVFGGWAERAGVARSLNYWAANVQSTYAPAALGLGSVHPDDGDEAPAIVREAFEELRLLGLRLAPQAGGYALDDPRLKPAYEQALWREAVVVIHAGRRPEAGPNAGAQALERLLHRYPELRVLVPYLGADEFEAFFELCDRYDWLYLDTAMVFNRHLGGPPALERLIEFQDRIVFGSSFPSIPYGYASAIQALEVLQLGPTIEDKLFRANAARLFNLRD